MKLVTAKQIDAILPFLDKFEADGFVAGELVCKPGQFPWTDYSDEVDEFTQALYDHNWVAPFDWVEWQETAERFVLEPERIESADTDTIRKLLTTHVRKERFSEGHLDAMFENGHIVNLLRRLRTIREDMD